MEGVIGWIQQSIDSNQMIAPVLFIAFHIIRPFLFIPVAFICINGWFVVWDDIWGCSIH